MGFTWSEIANQNFQQGSDYLKSVANQARKAYCASNAVLEEAREFIGLPREGLSPDGLTAEFNRSLCEIPADPVPLPPAVRNSPEDRSCQCQPYRVNYTVYTNGNVFDSGFVDRRGPIGTFRRVVERPGLPSLVQVGITHFGNITQPCLTAPVQNQLLQAEIGQTPQISIDGTSTPPGSTFVACKRPTLPTDRRRSPTDRQPPTVNIPRLPLPPISLPVIPVPVIIPVGGVFAPSLTLDVGGIHFNFTIGEVNITLAPKFSAPVTVFPPGYQQPSLPPSVDPDGSGGGLDDCCETVLANQKVINTNVLANQDLIKDVQNITKTIDLIQTRSVIPLLEDIKDCACEDPFETEIAASWSNTNSFTFEGTDRVLQGARITLTAGDPKKTWYSDQGVTVALVGWYSFGNGQAQSQRYPLQYLNNLCVPDRDDYTSFTFTLYKGLFCSGQLIRKKPFGSGAE